MLYLQDLCNNCPKLWATKYYLKAKLPDEIVCEIVEYLMYYTPCFEEVETMNFTQFMSKRVTRVIPTFMEPTKFNYRVAYSFFVDRTYIERDNLVVLSPKQATLYSNWLEQFIKDSIGESHFKDNCNEDGYSFGVPYLLIVFPLKL